LASRRGSATDPAEGAYSAPTDHLAAFNGPTSKERERKRRREGKEKKAKGREGKSGGGKNLAYPKILAWRPYSI